MTNMQEWRKEKFSNLTSEVRELAKLDAKLAVLEGQIEDLESALLEAKKEPAKLEDKMLQTMFVSEEKENQPKHLKKVEMFALQTLQAVLEKEKSTVEEELEERKKYVQALIEGVNMEGMITEPREKDFPIYIFLREYYWNYNALQNMCASKDIYNKVCDMVVSKYPSIKEAVIGNEMMSREERIEVFSEA